MASVPDWREGPLVHPLEVVVVEVQHFDEVEGGEGGAADAAQPAVGEVDGAQVRDGGEGEGGEGADRVVGEPQLADPDVALEGAREQRPGWQFKMGNPTNRPVVIDQIQLINWSKIC